jgi:hypothetical protein
MVLFSGLRMSGYIKKNLKKHTNKSVLIGNSTLDVSEVGYDEETNKNGLIAALILRIIFIIVFGFFIFIGLLLGISLYTQPNLDEVRGAQIIQNFETKTGKEIQLKINLLLQTTAIYNAKRSALEYNYTASIDSLKFAKNETHKMILAHDTAYFHKALIDWDFLYLHKANEIPISINKLQIDFSNELKKIKFLTEYKKFGTYRISEFKENKAIVFWTLFLLVSILFVAPYAIRYVMILKKAPLDIALEHKMVATINNDYREHHYKMLLAYKKYEVESLEIKLLYDDAPFRKRKSDEGEIVALKNQMNVFLSNEI